MLKYAKKGKIVTLSFPKFVSYLSFKCSRRAQNFGNILCNTAYMVLIGNRKGVFYLY